MQCLCGGEALAQRGWSTWAGTSSPGLVWGLLVSPRGGTEGLLASPKSGTGGCQPLLAVGLGGSCLSQRWDWALPGSWRAGLGLQPQQAGSVQHVIPGQVTPTELPVPRERLPAVQDTPVIHKQGLQEREKVIRRTATTAGRATSCWQGSSWGSLETGRAGKGVPQWPQASCSTLAQVWNSYSQLFHSIQHISFTSSLWNWPRNTFWGFFAFLLERKEFTSNRQWPTYH